MIWSFSILDRNGIIYPVPEPVGADALEIALKRDLDKHGVFFNYTSNTFTFYDTASIQLIMAEEAAYGVDGELTLILSYDCGNSQVAELYRGRMLFTNYQYNCGDTCSVSIQIETTGDVMQLRNRIDQKVDLDSLVAFDETTALPAYPGLGVSVQLPSKGIFLQNKSVNEAAILEYFPGEIKILTSPSGVILLGYYIQISIPYSRTIASEIGDFYQPPTPTYKLISNAYGSSDPNHSTPDRIKVQSSTDYTWEWPLDADVTVNYSKDSANYGTVGSPVNVQHRVKWSLAVTGCYVRIIRLYFLRLPDGKDGTQWQHYQVLQAVTLFSCGNATHEPFPGTYGEIKPGEIRSFDTTYSNPNFQLEKGDRIYHYISLNYYKTLLQAYNTEHNGLNAFDVKYDTETAFSMTGLSHTPPSPAKLYLPNEAFSRVAESITNNRIKSYSNYLGRTDSQPYSHTGDGCASLQPVTNGIRIRQQENRIVGKPIAFSQSINDLWAGYAPIHHLGMGIEADPNRSGFQCLRIEPWKYFYDNTVVLTCLNIGNIQLTKAINEHYSTATFGYQKWEAEEYNGLDEFLTKRQYRTALSQVKNELSKLSTYIASGYAWEVTRRKQTLSSDWRYDNDTFVICLTRKGGLAYNVSITTLGYMSLNGVTVAPAWAVIGASFTLTGAGPNDGTYIIGNVSVGVFPFVNIIITTSFPAAASNVGVIVNSTLIAGFTVELGNVLNPQNIIEPSTLYNYRISPERMAMRWIDEVFRSYRNQTGAKLIFNSGDGNYHAAGEQESTTCKIENQAITESQDIDASLFASAAAPILRPERVKFDYPMDFDEFILLRANPKGLIAYQNDCISGQGWIDNISYKPNEGLASFTLIPQIV